LSWFVEDEFIKRRELVSLVTAYHVIPDVTAADQTDLNCQQRLPADPQWLLAGGHNAASDAILSISDVSSRHLCRQAEPQRLAGRSAAAEDSWWS
jgi:hypothetical protein